MANIRLYGPSLVLGGWAAVWALGCQGRTVVLAFLVLLTLATVGAELERKVRRGGR